MPSPEARAEGLTQAMANLVDHLEKRHLRPLQKRGFLQAADCCDTCASQQDLQAWAQAPVQRAQDLVNASLQDFSGRLQRCSARCQDVVQGRLPVQPSERQIKAAQEELADCLATCAQEHESQVPKLQAEITQQLQRIAGTQGSQPKGLFG